jgi:hypothetical protein
MAVWLAQQAPDLSLRVFAVQDLADAISLHPVTQQTDDLVQRNLTVVEPLEVLAIRQILEDVLDLLGSRRPGDATVRGEGNLGRGVLDDGLVPHRETSFLWVGPEPRVGAIRRSSWPSCGRVGFGEVESDHPHGVALSYRARGAVATRSTHR